MELFTLLPDWYQNSIVFCLGLIIGSFLNVVIYRYHTGKSLNGHSHCLSCGVPLKWYELFPLVSYLSLRGRCNTCGCTIPARYFIVEIVTAAAFLLTFLAMSFTLLWGVAVVLVAVLIVISVYDIHHMVIPDELTLTLCVLGILYYVALYSGQWDMSVFLLHVASGIGAFAFYGGLWLVSKGRWIGFGDAKLAIPLGFMLGVPSVLSFIVFSFWIGAVVSIALLVFPAFLLMVRKCYTTGSIVKMKKSLTMKSEVPFAPFMIAAFLVVLVYQADVISVIERFL